MTTTAARGVDSFNEHFAGIFGDRWKGLLKALLEPTRHVALANPFVAASTLRAQLMAGLDSKQQDSVKPLAAESKTILSSCFVRTGSDDKEHAWPPPSRDTSTNLLPYFLLDASSVLSPLALMHDAKPGAGERVFDMCAAPGGKSLVLAFSLFAEQSKTSLTAMQSLLSPASAGEAALKAAAAAAAATSAVADDEGDSEAAAAAAASSKSESVASKGAGAAGAGGRKDDGGSASGSGSDDDDDDSSGGVLVRRSVLVSNDASAARRKRLQQVIVDYLPRAIAASIRVTGLDGAQAAHGERGGRVCYDRVLLDAPCSSERHVLADPGELATWTPARSKQMAARQFALLTAACKIARPKGGRIVYSTCSLSPLENDRLVAKLLKTAGADAAEEGKEKGKGKGAGAAAAAAGGGKLRVRLLEPPAFPFGERTKLGWQVLPDTCGWGPFYLAVLERL